MKSLKLIAAVGLAVILTGTLAVTALAEDTYGSSSVTDSGTYTLEEMLTYAMEDEYLAYAEYAQIIDTFGSVRPFSNIINAEATHIEELATLFEAYGLAVPENTASDYVTVPDDISDALSAGVQAEINNIAMYDAFLSQTLPDDVRDVFEALRAASAKHLTAFERGLARPSENGTASGYGASGGNGYASGNSDGICNEDCSGAGYRSGTCDEDCDEASYRIGSGNGYNGNGNGTNLRAYSCTD